MATPAVTYGVDGVADHPSASPLTIVQVELVDAEDLVLVEASIIPGWNVASINSYPPDAATLEEHELTELWEERTPAEGAAIEANKGAELVVAVRLVEGAEAGSVADIRVHYQEAGGSQRYVGRANLGLYLVPHPSQCEEVAP